jgi:hypothetical protein
LRKAGMTQAIGSVRMARRLISVAPTCAWALHRSQPPVAPWSVRSESATPRARPYQSTRPKILWSRSDSDPLAPSPFRLTRHSVALDAHHRYVAVIASRPL